MVGGRGSPGDAHRVVAYLAAQLPGWGDLELARRGKAIAEDLINGAVVGAAGGSCHVDALPVAGSAAFAEAFLAALGPVWMGDLLRALGDGDFGPESSLARLVASALGAAAGGGGTGPAADVLAAEHMSAG